MSNSPPNLCRLVRLCVVEGGKGPWRELLAGTWETAKTMFLATGGNSRHLGEFRDWFGGWLFADLRRLQTLLEALDRAGAGHGWTATRQDEFAQSYLAQIVRTGTSEFYRERASREVASEPAELALAESPAVEPGVQPDAAMHALLDALALLPENLRVPFRLKYYAACGPLSTAELSWIAAQSGEQPDEIERAVKEEYERRRGHEFPLSTRFIAQLLHVSEPNTVDQWIARQKTTPRDAPA